MTIQLISTLLFSLLLGTCAPAPSITIGVLAQSNLDVRVSDIAAPGKGTLVFVLFNSADGFPKDHDEAFRRGEVSSFGDMADYSFRELPSGTYALVVYQDLNNNGKMDTNFIGMPKEPLVASNMTKMAKPSFRRSSFIINEPRHTLNVKLMNQ
jgi:uncharacterized protein (DUF2141 family)